MATTRKRESTRKKKVGEVAEEVKSHLHHDHLRVLEVTDRDIQIARLEMATEEQSLHNLVLSLRLLESKIEKQKEVLSSKAQKYEQAKKKYVALKQEIWPQYGLAEGEGLGFNPDTGEIVRN
jgi:hypothetical protein